MSTKFVSETCSVWMPLNSLSRDVQCPLDIQTLDKAAALPIAAATGVTDLRQYINSNLVFRDLNYGLICSEIATVKVVIPNGLKPILLLATTWSLYQAEIHLI